MRDVKSEIDEVIKSNAVVVFMKGTPSFPQCGFSATVADIFRRLDVPFAGVNVLADGDVRQGIKDYSNWPTIPQVYVGGEFLGGCDIATQLFESGELRQKVDAALSAATPS